MLLWIKNLLATSAASTGGCVILVAVGRSGAGRAKFFHGAPDLWEKALACTCVFFLLTDRTSSYPRLGAVDRIPLMNDPFWKLPEVPHFSLTSPDLEDGAALPPWARSGIAGAGGDDRSPELEWSGAPEGTQSFALTMYDPDAPTGSGWWHWAVHGIPATTTSLPSNAGDPEAALLPHGAVMLPNEIRLPRYLGAAPPAGHGDHRYYFVLSALDTAVLDVDPASTPAFLGFVLRDHIIGRAVLMGTSRTD